MIFSFYKRIADRVANRFSSNQRYWHATSKERAIQILRTNTLKKPDKKGRGIWATFANRISRFELMENVAVWFIARGYYPETIVLIEFSTDTPPDSKVGISGRWVETFKIKDAKIIEERAFSEY